MNEEMLPYIARHEASLKTFVEAARIPALSIHEAILYALFPGGKRIRPLLIYLSGKALGVKEDVLDVLAAAVELMHCYSLIHDDLPAMDNDDLRRGKPSCHRAFDEATAILAGDAMQALAPSLLIHYLKDKISPVTLLNIIEELLTSSGANGMVSGQAFDLSELHRKDLSLERLKMIHILKTGKLFSASINMALLASEKNDITCKNQLTAFIHHLSLAFQMQDDWLDKYGKPETIGRLNHSDARNEKITFAVLFDKENLQNLVNSTYDLALQSLPATIAWEPLRKLTEWMRERSSLSFFES